MRRLKARLGQAYLRFAGWELQGQPPAGLRKYVLIAAPHTSNWDGPAMLAMAAVLGIDVQWMGKDDLFKPPMGRAMKALGGIPIDRRKGAGVVEQMVRRFEQSDELALLVPVSGTRSYADHWKSGFYHIAKGAKVPVCLSYLDFRHKKGGIGPCIELSGDMRADMDRIRAFYRDKEGLYPQNQSKIRLREEDSLE